MRHVRLALILLPLGAGVTLAVAWAGALGRGFREADLLEQYTPVGPSHHWLVHRWDVTTGTRIMSSVWYGSAREPYNAGPPARLLAGWGRIEAPDGMQPVPARRIDEGWGFPMRAMACGVVSVDNVAGEPSVKHEDVWQLRDSSGTDVRGRYVPTRPIWLGLGIDTLVYGLSIMVAAALARDGWRLLRRRGAAAP